MTAPAFRTTTNGTALPLDQIPVLPFEAFKDSILRAIREGARLAGLFSDGRMRLYAVLAEDAAHRLAVGATELKSGQFPSLTPVCPQAHLFEREIAEQYGLLPTGHPWLKPVRFHPSWVEGRDAWNREGRPLPGVMDFYAVNGEEVHEVAVGPVHAGVIEPGHFRFQCHGEKVFHLEIALGYQHRGIEQALIGGPHPLSLKMAETVAGDSSIAHAWTYCRVLEGLAGIQVAERTDLVRGVALELERMANHVGDLGALAGDVGFLPTASFCGRIRGDWLNLTAEVCGSRLGRDWLKPGGLRHDLEPALAAQLLPKVAQAWEDTRNAVELLWGAASVMVRFEAAGHLEEGQARNIGLVGVAARACGIDLDVRRDHPFGPFAELPIEVGLAHSGNVHARAWVRWTEAQASVQFLMKALDRLAERPLDEAPAALPPLAADHFCAALTEGWRGEVLHVALTGADGRFLRYKIVDPSFHNWFGLALALRGEEISDFPLCNKSFNLSYCGHDL
jgi:Ni,Fe-hydrogenase III large subunit